MSHYVIGHGGFLLRQTNADVAEDAPIHLPKLAKEFGLALLAPPPLTPAPAGVDGGFQADVDKPPERPSEHRDEQGAGSWGTTDNRLVGHGLLLRFLNHRRGRRVAEPA
jgi:hypothetical protein